MNKVEKKEVINELYNITENIKNIVNLINEEEINSKLQYILVDFSRVGMTTFHSRLDSVETMINIATEHWTTEHIKNNFFVYSLKGEQVCFEFNNYGKVFFTGEC